ncbi:hypothetical protein GIB67_028381 [Kingdonia uniflora]|uniref:non-specific serine/threonine protein kinase n=1 Tax=Kingdonia uniflora TaxID=39325 RepID=A0A7J7MHT8_9MAGN|nr:hypothetical protein GIB67_028381 [Kingdonia uniflora]
MLKTMVRPRSKFKPNIATPSGYASSQRAGPSRSTRSDPTQATQVKLNQIQLKKASPTVLLPMEFQQFKIEPSQANANKAAPVVALNHCATQQWIQETHMQHERQIDLIQQLRSHMLQFKVSKYLIRMREMMALGEELFLYVDPFWESFVAGLEERTMVNPHTHQLKICDFGSAKVLVPGEPNISYICSRYYRAPELIFGATEYTTTIDMWSVGCVLAELLLGQPLFPGESGVDQLVEVIKVLGTPTREEIKCMNPNYNEFKFPQIKAHPWHKIFHKRMPPEAVDLVSRLLQYSPKLRCTALEACGHHFFDDLRDPNAHLPNGRPLPPLFNFTPQELTGVSPELLQRLVPDHVKK